MFKMYRITKIFSNTRETPATCINCGGDQPTIFSTCRTYLEWLTRFEDRKAAQQPVRKIFALTSTPAVNAWNRNKVIRKIKELNVEDIPPLPDGSRSQSFREQKSLRPSNRVTWRCIPTGSGDARTKHFCKNRGTHESGEGCKWQEMTKQKLS